MDKTRMNYFQEQEKAAKDSWERVNYYIKQIPEQSLKIFVERYANEMLAKKRKIRTSLVKGTCLILDKDNLWGDVRDLAAAVELWCISDYFTNICFDGKFERLPEGKDTNLCTIASAVTRELAQDALTNSIRKLKPEKETELVNLLSYIVKEAYYHQWIDYGELRIPKGKEVNPQELEVKLSEIFRKRYGLYHSGNFFGQYPKMTAILLGANEQECRALESFGDNLSIGCQIVNDTADLLNEGYDLKNRLLTLPLIYIILETGKNVYEIEREKVADLFVNSHAFEKTRAQTKELMRKAKQSLKIFPKENRWYLPNFATLLHWNRQFRSCKSQK